MNIKLPPGTLAKLKAANPQLIFRREVYSRDKYEILALCQEQGNGKQCPNIASKVSKEGLLLCDRCVEFYDIKHYGITDINPCPRD